MAISRVSRYGGSSAYKYPTTVGNDAKDNTEFLDKAETGAQGNAEEELSSDHVQRGNASIDNVAISFGIYDDASGNLLGMDGLISNDMMQAISGMQKDQILREYQYFVGDDLSGNKSSIIASTEDGLVIKKN
ncbi:hypothetical protein [Butyrivibrio hungatei]|uniref:hypothetical protein n=1 Tax=Butyrivibrio hungatei TaxID=185008 RepID=UPI000412B271|nr:hypothetical protein [Butyrivibrio hungatei]